MFVSKKFQTFTISSQHGKSDKEERDMSLGQVANWRQDTDQQFREVQNKLRPLPDEVCLNDIKWPFFFPAPKKYSFPHLASVVQRLDNTIYQINCDPMDKC